MPFLPKVRGRWVVAQPVLRSPVRRSRHRAAWRVPAAVAVGIGVCFSVLLMSVAYGVSWGITHRLDRIRDPAVRHLVNVGLIDSILVLLTVVVATAMLAQTAAATFTFGVTVMNARREEVAIRRQSGVLRSTLLREFMLAMLVPCVAGGVVGEAAGVFAAALLRTFTVLPVRFNAVALLGAFPVTVALALLATLIPGWRFANASPALLRRG
jgi:hypothetical protein